MSAPSFLTRITQLALHILTDETASHAEIAGAKSWLDKPSADEVDEARWSDEEFETWCALMDIGAGRRESEHRIFVVGVPVSPCTSACTRCAFADDDTIRFLKEVIAEEKVNDENA